MMPEPTDPFLASLIADLRPVAPLRPRDGMARAVLALAAGVVAVVGVLGVRHDFASGHPQPMVLIAAGLFLVLALASAWTVIDMARPAVGARRDGWGWTALMAAVLPLAALTIIAGNLFSGQPTGFDPDGWECLALGSVIGLVTGGALTFWVRRGAPSSPARAGLLIGVAAGAAGIFAVSLCCPSDSLLHIGIWHGATVIVMGAVGRILLPRVLAW